MHTHISPQDARRLVLDKSDLELWSIASALDKTGPEFCDGVSVQLVVDMLEVGETENWERTARNVDKVTELFRPFATVPRDGKMYRSWLPEDLDPNYESNIRALAEISKNDFVRARIYEILWARFRKFPDADATIDARFASATQCDPEQDWPRQVQNLGRLITLILAVNAKTRFDLLVSTLDVAADKLAQSTRPFSFSVLADVVSNTLLRTQAGRQAFGEVRAKRWAALLDDLARKFEGDSHHGHDALIVLQAWHARWNDDSAKKAAQRRTVEQLATVARNSDPQHAPGIHQRALQTALDFGIADLSETARRDLMQSIRAAIPTFKQISGSITIPPEILAEVDKIVDGNRHASGAIRQLSLLPGLLEVNIPDLRASAKEQLRDHPFYALVPSVHFHHEGKITFKAADPVEKVDGQVAVLISGHLVLVEAILGHALSKLLDRIEAGTLLEALAGWPHLPRHRAELLAVASARFADKDWISSAFIAIPLYEAVLRDLLRAVGYSALKVETGGVQMDETLNSLIRTQAARDILGDGHCDLVEYVLCDSSLGLNLRNDLAHGIIRASTLNPMRVLLAWLLIIRLTCFVAQPHQPNDRET